MSTAAKTSRVALSAAGSFDASTMSRPSFAVSWLATVLVAGLRSGGALPPSFSDVWSRAAIMASSGLTAIVVGRVGSASAKNAWICLGEFHAG